ncbi:2-C-methyl-D-erythritol 4-phosphate cytidylyltransferase [Ectothiorhodospiraceae bacterium BW-2]|nr:2-C-methyl-D-erythritol 4-phosphate cytidylyltransferase [Ectothiorhodospiraceae bacterium BW-2]
MSQSVRYWAIIPAAGIGRRMGGETPKQYLPLCGRTVLEMTLQRFLDHPLISGIVVVLSAADNHWPNLALTDPKLMQAQGGSERSESVLNGLARLQSIAELEDWVLVHDAARPCLSADDLNTLLQTLQHHPVGGLLGVAVADTLKRIEGEQRVIETISRDKIWRALTPQMFRYGLLRQALEQVKAEKLAMTDEASAIERLGGQPQLVVGSEENLKITWPQDLPRAEAILQRQQRLAAKPPPFRIGHGYDAHRFEADKPLKLGGVAIDYPKGLEAHSDGDVVLHALADALLGAAALGDIGQHFPDSAAAYRHIDSRILLRRVATLLQQQSWRVANCDITIIAQQPKLAPYIDAMRRTVAADLDIKLAQVSVKATTTEKMGFIGREEGIATHAVALLVSA